VSIAFARRIARFALAAGPMLDDEAVNTTVLRAIVDSLGCLFGARDGESVASARDVALEFHRIDAGSTVPSASIVDSPQRVTVEAATFVNGLAIRYLDFNDIYLSREAVHPSDAMSVAFALAEAYRIDGRRMLDAIACGYEVHCRLADAVSTRKNGWDHVLLNAIASAVVAGRLLKLEEDALTQAVALAATSNIPLMETRVGELSMWKAAAAAYAARAGLFAAIHARHGLTGPAAAFEGKHGLFAQVTGPADDDAFDATLATPQLLNLHLKAYPIGYFTQSAVDAALQLHGRFDPASVTRIEIETTAFGKLANADGPEKWNPQSRETADHSLPYGVAVALLDGQVHVAQFSPERILSADVQSLMKKVVVRENRDFTAAYPERVMTSVSLVSPGQDPHVALIEYPRGHARNPQTAADIDAKLLAMAPDARIAQHVSKLWNIPHFDGVELAALLRRVVTLDDA
jgi:2-methylcitrate dehydratase